jgi:hypothetical protein
MSNHYGFLTIASNNVFKSQREVYLTSSSSAGPSSNFKGFGTYMYQSNLRHCVALYGARVLSKHNWVNDQDRYIGRNTDK